MYRVLALVFLSALAACHSTPPPAPQHDYVFVWLKAGPDSAARSEADKKTIMAGHMENMQRLASEGKLVVAGPFQEGKHDKDDRGIFVLNVPTVDEARALVASDPGVKAGEFRIEACTMRSSPTLLQTLDLERESREKAKREGRDYGMGQLRTYQLVTMKDASKANEAMLKLEAERKIIWAGQFGSPLDGWAVIVLDAQTTQDAIAVLSPARWSLGEFTIDPWASTKSLEKLPALRAASH